MNKLKSFVNNGKIFILTCLVVISFYFSSIGWLHIDSSQETRVLVAAIILFILYALIVFELINRNLAALIGAAMSVAAYDCLIEFISMEQILQWLDLETLTLLFGMMIIVSVLGESGLFDFLAIWSYKQSKGHFWLLITIMSIITALLSALVDNVSTMLLISPTLIKLSELEHIDPRYVLMIMVIVCNIGGCATPVGDPPNLIIIGNDFVRSSLNINFGSFTGYCTPGVILILICVLVYIRLLYKSKESFRMKKSAADDDTISRRPGDLEAYSPEQPAKQENLIDELATLDLFSEKLDSLRQPISQYTKKLRCQLEEQTNQLRLEVNTHATTTTTNKTTLGQFEQLTVEDNMNGKIIRPDERRSSRLDEQEIDRLMQDHCIKDHRTLYESVIVLCVAILLFFLQSIPSFQLTLGWASLFCGLTLLLLNSRKGDESFERIIMKIEWTTLMFFFALFITMEAMSELGLIGYLGNQVTILIDCLPEGRIREVGAITIVLWASGLASACIDNVPFTSMMIKILATMITAAAGDPVATKKMTMASAHNHNHNHREEDSSGTEQQMIAMMMLTDGESLYEGSSSSSSSNYGSGIERALVFALSFGACLGGNGSLIGASANLVTAGVSNRLGYPITFNSFFKFAAPITILSLAVANLYLIVVFVWLGL